MEASELAVKMLEWERVKLQLDALAEEITQAVLAVGKTQTVGNVRATYSGGRKSYNYQDAADGHPMVSDATLDLFTRTVVTVDWKKVCEHVGIEDVPFKQSEPGVTLKTLE